MTKQLINKIRRERIYDTPNYRYVYNDNGHDRNITRIAIDRLDTTATLSAASDTNPNGWVTVWVE